MERKKKVGWIGRWGILEDLSEGENMIKNTVKYFIKDRKLIFNLKHSNRLSPSHIPRYLSYIYWECTSEIVVLVEELSE